jgi:hypothetical protein
MLLEYSIVSETTESFACQSKPLQIEIYEDKYVARFTQTKEELNTVLKLQFEIFNLELTGGLYTSFQAGRDEFAATCDRL